MPVCVAAAKTRSTSAWKPPCGAPSEPAKLSSQPVQRRLSCSRTAPKGTSRVRAKAAAALGVGAVLRAEVGAKKALASDVSGEGESVVLLSAVVRAAACVWLRRSPRSFAADGSRRPARMVQSGFNSVGSKQSSPFAP